MRCWIRSLTFPPRKEKLSMKISKQNGYFPRWAIQFKICFLVCNFYQTHYLQVFLVWALKTNIKLVFFISRYLNIITKSESQFIFVCWEQNMWSSFFIYMGSGSNNQNVGTISFQNGQKVLTCRSVGRNPEHNLSARSSEQSETRS